MSSTQDMTVRGILDDYHFKVPKYQRKYSWSKKEIDAFLEDLKNVHKDNTVKPKKYFFGSMVFEGSVKTTIIDGQQRLATVSLFLASIIEVCHMLQSKKEELSNKYELNYQKFSKHESLIEDARKRLFRNEKEIVELGGDDKQEFNELICKTVKQDKEYTPHRNHTRLLSNYKQILKWIHAFINFKEFSSNLQQKQQAYKELSKSIHRSRMEKNSSKSKTEEENQREIEKDIKNSSEKFFQDSVTELDSLFKTCLDSFFVIAFFAESKIGQMIFETLNSRGKPLEVQDLLKNYIIRKTDDRDLDDIIKSWDDIINNVGENHIAKFLLAFYQANKRKSSNADLFHNYRNFATNPPEILKLLEDLRKASIHFKKIICPESRNQRISKELTAALSDLNTIDSTSFHPLLLLLFMNESKPAHIEKVAKNCLVILLRNKTIMGDKADDLMNMSLDLCTKVRDKNPTESYSEIKNKFETMFAKHSDNSFISKLIEKQFKGKDATARILLTKIYLNLGQLPPPEYQLEHIIPQAVAKRLTERSPKGVTEWIEYLNSYKLDKDNMIYRIGNFTLLDRDAQLDAGTKFIDEKIKVFKKSPLKQIDEITENDFTEQGFEDRCERLSKHVAKALVVKF